jgi:hypothetical protein
VRPDLLRVTLVALACSALIACPAPPTGNTDDGGQNQNDAGTSGDDGGTGTDAGPVASSAKGNVLFKRSERLRNDFSQALSLDPATICREFGQYSCTDQVHSITLGGVEPYTLGINDPLPSTGVATPLVIDRLALSGCTQRVAMDLATPAQAVIFKALTPDAAGKLSDLEAPAVAASIDLLYKRLVLRPPTVAELGHMKQLYRDIEAKGKPDPAKSWMVLSCFAVASSVESIFY